MAATTRSASSTPAPADPPLSDIPEVREVRPGGALTFRARSGTHPFEVAVTAAIRVEADQ